MQIGTIYPQIELKGDPEAVRAIGRATEELGYDYLLAYDHVVGAPHEDRDPPLWGPYTDNDPFHDPMVMFAYLAGMTERIEFATGVIILPQRQTVLLAKQAADLDLLSGGRLRLGVGVGWNYVEYEALGQDFDSRGARANEQIDLMRRLWREPLVSFDGEFDRIDRGNVIPRPDRDIPVYIGGFSEPAFRRAGKQGDGFMFAGKTERCLPGLERVKHHLEEAGRSLDGYGVELLTMRTKTFQEAIDSANQWRELGGTHVCFSSMDQGFDSIEAHLDYFSRVKDALA